MKKREGERIAGGTYNAPFLDYEMSPMGKAGNSNHVPQRKSENCEEDERIAQSLTARELMMEEQNVRDQTLKLEERLGVGIGARKGSVRRGW